MNLTLIDGPYGMGKYPGDVIRTVESERLYRRVIQAAEKSDSDHLIVFGVFTSLSWIYETVLRHSAFVLRQPCVWHKPDSVGGGNGSFVPQHESFLHLAIPFSGFNVDSVRVPYGERAKSGVKMKGGKEVEWQPHSLGARRGNVMSFTSDRLKSKIAGRTQPNAHPCVKPVDLLRVIVLACSSEGGIVFEPFVGSDRLRGVCEEAKRTWRGYGNASDFISEFK